MLDTAAETDARLAVTDPTVRFRRIAGALCLPLGFVLQQSCNAIYAVVSTESGLSDTESAAEALELYGRYPGQLLACTVLAMIGVLVMIPGLLAALHVLRPSKPRLALWAVVLMIGGYVSYFGVVGSNFASLALAQYARSLTGGEAEKIWEASANPAQLPFFLLFVVGNLVGNLLLGLAIILAARRQRELTWWAGALIMCWTVGHIVNLVGGGEWFAVAGGILQIVGLAFVSAAALRTSNADWAARG